MIFPVILSLVALGGLLIVLKRTTTPPGVGSFDVQEIRQAGSLPELDAYYNLIGEMLIKGEVNYVEYMALYNAYEARYLELSGEA